MSNTDGHLVAVEVPSTRPERVGTWEIDADFSRVTLDPKARAIFQSPLITEPLNHWCERADPEGQRRLLEHLQELRGAATGGFQLELSPATHGEPRCVELTALVAEGRVRGAVRDCSTASAATRRGVQTLLESESRFRTMANGLPLIVWVHDAQGQQEFVNATFCEFFGVTEAEMRGGRWQLLMHPDDAAEYAAEFARCVRERQPFHGETRVRRADGEWRWIESFSRPRYSPAGDFLGFVGTSVDVTERKAGERALREARDEALAATRAKDRFLAIVSHELRGPLAPLMLIANQCVNDPLVPEELRADFRIVEENVNLLARLVGDLMDLHVIDRQTLSLQRRPVDLHELLQRVLLELGPEFSAKDLRLVAHLNSRDPVVSVDPHRIRQVLWNLLRNALKFTAPGGEVSVETRDEGDLVVRVRDTGIGMKPDELVQIFEAFAQGEQVVGSRAYGGLGLGLTIARMLVQGHGGTIRAESAGRGRGSCLIVHFPRAAPG